ncbi:uncharacterized [Tachysurus ichikawai]
MVQPHRKRIDAAVPCFVPRAMRQLSVSASASCRLSRIDVDATPRRSESRLLHINPDPRTRRDSLNTPTRGGPASPSNRAA